MTTKKAAPKKITKKDGEFVDIEVKVTVGEDGTYWVQEGNGMGGYPDEEDANAIYLLKLKLRKPTTQVIELEIPGGYGE